jgi:hypothetical protein
MEVRAMQEVFYIEPASGRSMWFFAVILVPLLLLFGWFAYASRQARFELRDDGLRIRSAVYGRTIPAHSLVVEDARIVDLRRELQPTLRTNGIGMPGYSAGWFRLRGESRALLFVTDRSRVVYLPTREGWPVLLSVQEPEAFLEALRQRYPAGTSPAS